MGALLWEWLNLAARWLHIVTAIAWIGSSFYFIALDLSLKKREGLARGVSGDAWQVHGGGFYHMQKYAVAPAEMPAELTWFKWESYWTWISGFFLMCVLYYASADLYLVDREVADLAPWQAIAIGVGGLALGWIVYDGLCRTPLGRNDWLLYGVLFVFISVVGWGFLQVFSGRGAFIHTGALIATIMSANVAMIIIPNQRKVVASLLAGETPDPRLGAQAKQRSLHNNYLTLPVIVFMLSNHYPLAHSTQHAWAIIPLVLAMGVSIRHYFNTYHRTHERLWWTWAVTAILFVLALWVSQAGPGPASAEGPRADTGQAEALAGSPIFAAVQGVVETRCAMCHAAEPVWDGIAVAPKGVRLDTPAAIARHGSEIYVQAARSRAMPPGNITALTGQEREMLARWFETATGQPRTAFW